MEARTISTASGVNSAYYLLKADKVVGVEANPELCAEAEERFSREIADGRLVVLNCALSTGDAGPVDFYIHKHHHVLSQLGAPDEAVAADFRRIEVESRHPADIVREHGQPRYIKVDLEGFDVQVLRALFAAGIHPPEISAESHLIDVFACLVEAGYKAFNLVEGWSVQRIYSDARIETLSGPRQFGFRAHSAGPFGEDLLGDWQDADTFFETLAAVGLGWKDIHASDLIEPTPQPSGARIRRQALALARRAIRGARSPRP